MSKILKHSIKPLRRVLNFLEKHHRASTSKARTLQAMPSEILIKISSYLPRECALILTLTCKQFFARRSSRKQYDELEPSEKHEFLHLLVLSLPDSIACPTCLRIHHNKDIHHYGIQVARRNELGKFPPCIQKDEEHEAGFGIPYLLSTTVFRMVMKKYHYRPASRELLDQISGGAGTTFTRWSAIRYDYGARTTFTPWCTIRYSHEEYRIFHGDLYHRAQVILTPYFRYDSLWQDVMFMLQSNGYEYICAHNKLYYNDWLKDTSDRRIQGCQHCRTEYRISFGGNWTRGLVIIFESWRNFGSNPASATWIDHLPNGLIHEHSQQGQARTRSGYLVCHPSIANVFGDTQGHEVTAWVTQAQRRDFWAWRDSYRKVSMPGDFW